MSTHSRSVFLSVILLFMLLFSLGCPTAAYADDGTPPPPATEEPVQPPTEEPAADLPGEVPPPLEGSGEESVAAEDAMVTDVLESAPEGTEIIVLNDEGSPEPLATQEAAEIIQNGDPRYTVLGTTYYFMPTGGCGILLHCTESAAPIQTAIDYLSGMPGSPWPGTGATPDDSTIYVEDGTYTEDVLIVGTASWKPTSLTLSGAGSSTTTLDGSFNIIGMNIFTLSGFTVSDADNSGNSTSIIALGNTGTMTLSNLSVANNAGNGIDVSSHTGDIILANVNASGNADDGADLDNSFGSGNINISSSTFGVENNGNGGDGLEAYSNGDITLSGVVANGNADDGAYLDNIYGSGSINVSTSTFGVENGGNGSYGLEAYSSGDIILSGVTANGNADNGAYLDTGYGSGSINVSSSIFSDNGVDGLEAYSNGDVTLASVTANGNSMAGLFVFTTGNAILTGVRANGNGANGATIIGLYGNVLISKSYFDGNVIYQPEEGIGAGLIVVSFFGNVELNTISASNNMNGTGAEIGSYNAVIQNSVFNGNGYDGLSAVGGNVSIVCSQFVNNSDVGVDGSSLSGTFTLNDVTFDNNSENYLGTPVIMSGGCAIVKGNGGKSSSSLPLHIVPVNSDDGVELNCSAFSGTELVLPNGDKVILHCPLLGEAVLIGQTQDQLTGALTSQYTFLSALKVQVSSDGETVKTVSPALTVDFVIPEGQQGANFAILHWSGGEWVEIPDCIVTPNGFFQARTNYTGLFVLVRK